MSIHTKTKFVVKVVNPKMVKGNKELELLSTYKLMEAVHYLGVARANFPNDTIVVETHVVIHRLNPTTYISHVKEHAQKEEI